MRRGCFFPVLRQLSSSFSLAFSLPSLLGLCTASLLSPLLLSLALSTAAQLDFNSTLLPFFLLFLMFLPLLTLTHHERWALSRGTTGLVSSLSPQEPVRPSFPLPFSHRSRSPSLTTALADVAWAALWGCFYRKYFWDFVGGELGPKGIMCVCFLFFSKSSSRSKC
jgi:hypothetical protein